MFHALQNPDKSDLDTISVYIQDSQTLYISLLVCYIKNLSSLLFKYMYAYIYIYIFVIND